MSTERDRLVLSSFEYTFVAPGTGGAWMHNCPLLRAERGDSPAFCLCLTWTAGVLPRIPMRTMNLTRRDPTKGEASGRSSTYPKAGSTSAGEISSLLFRRICQYRRRQVGSQLFIQ